MKAPSHTNPSSKYSLNSVAHASNTALEKGRLYQGIVTDVSMQNGTVTIHVPNPSAIIRDVKWAGGIFSSMFGVRTKYLPPKDSRVLVMYGDESFVLGGIRRGLKLTADNITSCLTSDEKYDLGIYEGDDTYQESSTEDMLEGELDMTNILNVGLTLLTNMAHLKAGDLAKVECMLLDDMVRIVSGRFKHITPVGDYEIISKGGRASVIWQASSYEHEGLGCENLEDPKAVTLKDDGETVDNEGNVTSSTPQLADVDLSDIEEGSIVRFQQFIGFLGDFINEYVSDPVTTLSETAKNGSGKSRFARTSDGTVLIQSTNQVIIERVCRIPVPVQIKEFDAEDGIKNSDVEAILKNTNFLKDWDYSGQDIYHSCYQLREYARWLSGLHSLARMHQLSDEWKIPKESDVEAPLMDNGEADRKEVTSQEYMDAYSTIRIMQDGSIVTMDAYGSSVVMGKGNTKVSAAKHLFLEAAEDINLVAGNDVNILAKRHIEMNATTGAIRSYARTLIQHFCALGSIWLKTEATKGQAKVNPTDPDPVLLNNGLVFESKASGVGVNCTDSFNVSVKGGSTKPIPSIDFASKGGNINLVGDKGITLHTLGNLGLSAVGKVLTTATSLACKLATYFNINDAMIFSGGKLEAPQMTALDVTATKLTHLVGPGEGMKTHLNHVFLGGSYTPSGITETDVVTPVEPYAEASGEVKVNMNDDYPSSEDLFESLSQQHIFYKGVEGESFEVWDWAKDNPLLGSNAGDMTWPGKGITQKEYRGGEDLQTPSDLEYKSLPNMASPLKDKTVVFRKLT